MKRKLILLLTALLALACCALAETSAEFDCPINPYFEEAQPQDPPQSEATVPRRAKAASTRDYFISRNIDSGFFSEDTTWTITVTDVDENGDSVDITDKCLVRWYLANLLKPMTPGSRPKAADLNVNCYKNWDVADTFTYRFVAADPIGYVLRADVYYCGDTAPEDVNTAEIGTNYRDNYDLLPTDELADTENHATVEAYTAVIANQCLEACGANATDFDKALWLHDWLTWNACYDYSYSYYSADGVLFRHTGVCDSYCKAYIQLLAKVGIQSVRVSGNNHAWNRTLIDGVWTQIDPTWDDPGKNTEPASGSEHHIYFGLTDTLMLKDHTYAVASDAPCDSLAMNYFVQNGNAAEWLGRMKTDALERLEDGAGTTVLRLADYLLDYDRLSSHSAKRYIPAAITAWLLERDDVAPEITLLGGANVWLDYAMTNDNALRADALPVLELPETLSEIGESAFDGSAGLRTVMLSDGISALGARAFADCAGLLKIYIPAGIAQGNIDSTAFEGSPNVTIYCAAGSGAAEYAGDAGLLCRHP